MIELFVEKKRVDVDKSFSTLLTMAIDDIKDFGSKNTTYSKSIVLPGTKNNNNLFGNIFKAEASNNYLPTTANIGSNFNPAIAASAYIFADNMQIFKGVIRVLGINIDDGFIEYECSVFGELGGFVAKLGNKKIEELDFSAHDLVYSVANIAASWNNTPGSGVYFPLIDYGNYSVNKADWDYQTFKPALYAKEYIDKIFTGAGYTYSSALFDSARFKSQIIPHNQKNLRTLKSELVRAERAANHTIISGTANVADFYIYQSFYGAGFSINGSNNRITYFDTPAVSCVLYVQMSGEYINDLVDLEVKVLKNGSVVAVGGGSVFPDTGGPSTFGTWDFVKAFNIDFVTSDYIEVEFSKTGLSRTFQIDSDYCLLTITSQAPIYALTPLGDPITLNDTIPRNYLQKDFLSSIVKLNNLYIFEDNEIDKRLRIEPFVDFYLDADSVDWSLKIDRSKPLKYKPMSELNSRYYEFNYKSDSDYYNDLYKKRYNQSYGSYKYDSEFEFTSEVNKVDLIFSGTPLVGYSGEDKVYPTIFKRTGTTTIVEENIDSNIRILQTKKITGVTSWDIKNGATVLASYTSYGYAGHFDDPDAPANDLNFGVAEELFFTLLSGAINVNQFNIYWSSYMAEVTDKDSKMLTCTARLTKKDIFELDFSKLVYVDGVLYRLNQITDFNASNEDTCTIELIKVINRIY